MSTDAEYLKILVEPIRLCAKYRPKLGRGGPGASLEDFQTLYQSDPFYTWFGLDHPLMYAAHKAAGGMTSIYRQIGIATERLFRQILMDHIGLTEDEAKWSYSVEVPGRKVRKLSLDGRIPIESVQNGAQKKKIETWIATAASDLDVAPEIAEQLRGIVFEVRQGYKSKDSKRQNADLANAATAYTQALLPCLVVLSQQIDSDILARYRAEKWLVLTGLVGNASPLRSTYTFTREIVGYDLAGFLERNSAVLKDEVENVLEALLSAGN